MESLSHASSDYVKGTFTLTGDVFDDEMRVIENTVNDYDLRIDINSSTYIKLRTCISYNVISQNKRLAG